MAQALAEMLKRAEPPICVGLYARWGAGKTFMISLLKKEFDPTAYEDPRTHRILQVFEKGYKNPEQKAPAKEPVISASLVCSCLIGILRTFMPPIPYGMVTFFSIIYDAFEPLRAARGCCFKLHRLCKAKSKIIDSGNVSYQRLPDEERMKTEFIFVDFNAWECVACVHSRHTHSRYIQ